MQAVMPPNWGDRRTESDARQTAASAADQDRRRARELEVLVIEVCFLVCRNPPQRLPRTPKITARLCLITSPAHSQPASTAPTRHSPAGIRGPGLARLGRDEAFDKIKRDLRHPLPAVVAPSRSYDDRLRPHQTSGQRPNGPVAPGR